VGYEQSNRNHLSKAAWIVVSLVFTIAVADAVLAPVPASKEPGFIDAVLASRAVIAALRIAIVASALFVVLSVVALTRRGQWLTRLGPVEVEELTVRAENDGLERRLEDTDQAVARLEASVAYTQQLINREGR
jgi:hypothetical protein